MLTRLTDTLARDAQARAAAAVAALLLGVLIGLVALIIAGAPGAAQATPPIIVVDATPTAQLVILIDGLFDYTDPTTRAQLDANTIACIDGTSGTAPGMVLVVVGDCDSGTRVWVREVDVPAAVGVRSLANLAPVPTQLPAPPPVAQQAPAQQQTVYVTVPDAAPPTADLCTAQTCDPAAAPTVCAANACWSAAAPEVVYVPAFGRRDQHAADPQPGDPGFADSFRDPKDFAFADSFRDPGCSQFIGYLPGDPCYRP